MHRYKINVEYKGTDYVGWQRQDNGMSIQESLEKAIKQLTSEKVDVFGAGRTDSGVHALNQVAHFDLKKNIELDSIRDGLNQYLRPQPIAIIKVNEVSSNFHARFSAKQREYSYKIVNRRSPLTVDQGMAWVLHKKLNIAKMKKAAALFIGKHDLGAFRSVNCQSKTSIKTIDEVEIKDIDQKIFINVKAKSFLHSQVRIMVGTLVYVGECKIEPKEINNIIKIADRKNAGPTAPAEGLYLTNVFY
tara:strand:+ start:536 stop:1273 length:738 start_codon:yes stop_codon:yes gene_type:complete